jgi:beta-glucosidase/6-phospho-beta-glucosidase/beta-galactosidase
VRFRSFVWGGFEGASHRRFDGRRVDAMHSSGHARWATLDLALLRSLGIRTVREALRWHLVEQQAGQFDWSSAQGQIRGALTSDAEVVWDLCHWGVPDGLDILSPAWPGRLARFAGAAARMLEAEGVRVAGWVPVNEMAFWAWAGGETGGFAPFLRDQGDALKRQLVLGHLAVVAALREAGAMQPILVCEPLIRIVTEPGDAAQALRAEALQAAAMAAVDAVLTVEPSAIDVLGLNFYAHNQWRLDGTRVLRGEPGYRPLRELLGEAQRRYRLPIVLTETGAEEPDGVAWSDHISQEVAAALSAGVDLRGVCIYPVADYAGWDNDRHCPCGPLGVVRGRRILRPAHRAAVARLQAHGRRFPYGGVGSPKHETRGEIPG